jgi:hypothetical protein
MPLGNWSQFSFHAAGYHLNGSKSTVLDMVMSSYSTSLGSFVAERRNGAYSGETNAASDAVLVVMTGTPGPKYLENAGHDIDMLQSLCPSLNLQPGKPNPNRSDVSKSLPGAKIFHFTGHEGLSVDPLQCCLLLSGGDYEPLTVEDFYVQYFHHQKPFLGYLSVCSTGSNEQSALIDGSVHLVGAVQQSGFRHRHWHPPGSPRQSMRRSCAEIL